MRCYRTQAKLTLGNPSHSNAGEVAGPARRR